MTIDWRSSLLMTFFSWRCDVRRIGRVFFFPMFLECALQHRESARAAYVFRIGAIREARGVAIERIVVGIRRTEAGRPVLGKLIFQRRAEVAVVRVVRAVRERRCE